MDETFHSRPEKSPEDFRSILNRLEVVADKLDRMVAVGIDKYEQARFDEVLQDFGEMDVAIRWAQSPDPSDPRFLIADVSGHTFKHCRVTGRKGNSLQWQEITRNSRAPAFRAFDWAPSRNIVVVGQWSGEATVLGLEEYSPTLSIPVKSQRQCNAVTFNSGTLLGTGLEKIRNDFCLNIYDVNHWELKNTATATKSPIEPYRKLASSEGIMSIKFFPDQPNVLVAGVKGSCVRLYDLRENTGNPVLQYQTSHVHNIAIDPSDPNYFASASASKESTVNIWDRRTALRPSPHRPDSNRLDGPLLDLKDVFGGAKTGETANIWSLRYSPTGRGCLGVLGSGGNFRILDIRKEYVSPDGHSGRTGGSTNQYAERVFVHDLETVGTTMPHHKRTTSTSNNPPDTSDQIRAFDHMNVGFENGKHLALVLRGNQDISIHQLQGPPSVLAISGKNNLLISDPRATTTGRDVPAPGLRIHNAPLNRYISDSLAEIKLKLKSLGPGTPLAEPTKSRDEKDLTTAGTKKLEIDNWDEIDNKAQNVNQKGPEPEHATAKRTIQDALLLGLANRRRSLEGYLLNPDHNKSVVKEDPSLCNMWIWVQQAIVASADGGMVGDDADFSFLGVTSIWNSQFGRNSEPRFRPGAASRDIVKATESLAESLGPHPIAFDPKTKKAAQRRVAFQSLGFRQKPDPIQRIKELNQAGFGPEGSLICAIIDHYPLLVTCLTYGPYRHTGLASIVQMYFNDEPEDKLTTQLNLICSDVTDPYYKAVIACISPMHWPACLYDPLLPPRYRAALALKMLPDDELTTFITNHTNTAIQTGDVASIFYTGLTEDAIPLFQNYIDRTLDLQSVALVLSYAAPRFLRNPRTDQWRKDYRNFLTTERLLLQRNKFDKQSIALSKSWESSAVLKPAPRQITVRCANCESPSAREQQQAQSQSQQPSVSGMASSTGSLSSAARVLGSDGTMCPRCGARLPRCTICDKQLGVVDDKAPGGESEEFKEVARTDPFAYHLEFCNTCGHMYHRGCGIVWFDKLKHVHCPMSGCSCPCNELDGPPPEIEETDSDKLEVKE